MQTTKESVEAKERGKYRAATLGTALGAGLVASLCAVLLMSLLLLLFGIPTPIDLFGEFLLKHITVSTFLQLLHLFGRNPKLGPLGMALLSMIVVGTLLGGLYALLVRLSVPVMGGRPGRREWLTGLAFGIAMTLVAVLLFHDELRANRYGLPVDAATWATIGGLFVTFVLYGLLLAFFFRLLLPKQRQLQEAIPGRRALLSRLGVAGVGLGASLGSFAVISDYLGQQASYDGTWTPTHNDITSPITPNAEHYVVTKNLVDPKPDIDRWRLEVTGLVGKTGSYTYTDLQKLPSTSRPITLECISNNAGTRLMGTAIWQGVTLRELLNHHDGAQSTAKFVAFYSIDGYTTSLPLDEVLAADALLAWRMNGTEIPVRHGYPLRVLIPGRYGEENPKWLTRVELTDHFVGGLYADQGWYNGPLHTTSRIDRPHGTLKVGQSVEVGGIAFAGNRGIQKVEISTDNGSTWHEATFPPPLSQDSWVLWTWQWRPTRAGSYTLVCRATDGQGQLQISKAQPTAPNGATGYHRVGVQVM